MVVGIVIQSEYENNAGIQNSYYSDNGQYNYESHGNDRKDSSKSCYNSDYSMQNYYSDGNRQSDYVSEVIMVK